MIKEYIILVLQGRSNEDLTVIARGRGARGREGEIEFEKPSCRFILNSKTLISD